MALQKVDTKIRIKTSSLTGDTLPIIGPTEDHTDGTWDETLTNEVYDNEFIWFNESNRLFLGSSEVSLFTSGGTSTTLPFKFTTGTTNVVTTTFGDNINNSSYSTIGGGFENEINTTGQRNVIGGGFRNDITLGYNNQNSVGGGQENRIRNGSSQNVICGGNSNLLDNSEVCTIGGGNSNKIYSSIQSSIGGGRNNDIVSSNYSTIVGGLNNQITGSTHSFIGAGLNNVIGSSVRASIVGGRDNSITNTSRYSFIGAGQNNLIDNLSNRSSIVGGRNNDIVSSNYSTIVGGLNNQITGSTHSFIVGGRNNDIVSSNYSTIVGGLNNQINGLTNTHIIGSNIIAHKSNTTYVETLDAKNGIMNEDNGIVLRKKVMEIDFWDMTFAALRNVPHGLTATEWKTIRNVQVMIRDDDDTFMISLDAKIGLTYETNFWSVNSTNIVLHRDPGGYFDSTDFDSPPPYNRGWVTIEYTPDV